MTSRDCVVFDTNVLLSAVLLPRSTPRLSFDHARARGVLLYSTATIQELEAVLRRPKFDRYTTLDARLRFLTAFIRDSEFVIVAEVITECRDPKDNKFLELAVSGMATHLVSGDSDLLELHPFRGIAILNPHDVLQLQ